MAELKVFGMPGCARCQGVKQYLANAGQNVRVGDSADSEGFEAAIRKALASNSSGAPEVLTAPLVVRGHQVVVANRIEQAGALRY